MDTVWEVVAVAGSVIGGFGIVGIAIAAAGAVVAILRATVE